MPQKTVTLEDQVYWELMQVAKGRQSAFVNEALKDAIRILRGNPWAYHWYAREGLDRARQYLIREDKDREASIEFNRAAARRAQIKLGVEEEEFQQALHHPNQAVLDLREEYLRKVEEE